MWVCVWVLKVCECACEEPRLQPNQVLQPPLRKPVSFLGILTNEPSKIFYNGDKKTTLSE